MTGLLAAVSGSNQEPLTVSCEPASVFGFWDSELSFGITDPTAATPHGGVAPYTYSWAKFGGDDFTLSPSSIVDTVNFNFSSAAHKSATYRVTVTDALSRTAHSDVSVTAN